MFYIDVCLRICCGPVESCRPNVLVGQLVLAGPLVLRACWFLRTERFIDVCLRAADQLRGPLNLARV